jgi:hypothetical protein
VVWQGYKAVLLWVMNLHTDFHSGHANLHLHQLHIKVSFCPTKTSPSFVVLFSWWLTFWLGLKWNLSVVLICIFFMPKDVEHFFVYLLVFVFLLLQTVCSTYLLIYYLFLCCDFFWALCIFWILSLYLLNSSGDFLPFCGLSLDSFFFF